MNNTESKLKITWHNDYTTYHEGRYEELADMLARAKTDLSYRDHLWIA